MQTHPEAAQFEISLVDARLGRAGLRPLAVGGAALVLASLGPASAGEGWDTLLFGSLDAGASTFLTVGAKVALDRLDGDGFVLLGSLGAGRRPERASCNCVPAFTLAQTRYTLLGSALVGYQWFHDWGVVAAFAGPETTAEMLADGLGARMAMAPRYGLRLHGEIWARPSADTLVHGVAILGTAREDGWARLAWGYRLWGAYLGPEASLYADRLGYRKWSFGVHATDFALGRYSLRVSAGLQRETGTARPAPYLSIATLAPF